MLCNSTQVKLQCFGFILLTAYQSDALYITQVSKEKNRFQKCYLIFFTIPIVCSPCAYFLGLASAQFLSQAWK